VGAGVEKPMWRAGLYRRLTECCLGVGRTEGMMCRGSLVSWSVITTHP